MSKKAITAKEETANALHTMAFYGGDIYIRRKIDSNPIGWGITDISKDNIRKLLDDETIVEITVSFKPNFDD